MASKKDTYTSSTGVVYDRNTGAVVSKPGQTSTTSNKPTASPTSSSAPSSSTPSSSTPSSSVSSSSSKPSTANKNNPNYNAAMVGGGGAVKEGEHTVYYNANGYQYKKVKDNGAGATTVDPSKKQQLDQLAATDPYVAAAVQNAKDGNWDMVGENMNDYTLNSIGKNQYGEYDNKAANDVMGWLGDVYGYDANKYYQGKYESVHGEGSWDGTTGTQTPTTQAPTTQTPGAGVQTPVSGGSGSNMSGGSASGSGAQAPTLETPNLKGYLDEWLAAAQRQQENRIDYATSQGINELTRAEEDAQAQFQTQRNQIAVDEAKAKDNQALYAEARGDKGGIGAAQYDSVMNTAARNRQAVNQAQTKLATDTQRQIADLRAQGEFEKADNLLQLSQTFLSQLMQLEQWALTYGLDVAKFNASLEQWAKEYDLAVGEALGTINGMPTLSAQQLQMNQDKANQSTLASAGETLLGLGIMPSESQLAAMGMTAEQAQEAVTAAKMAAAAKGNGKDTGVGGPVGTMDMDGLFEAATQNGGYSWLKQKSHYSKYGFDSAPTEADYKAWVAENGVVVKDPNINDLDTEELRNEKGANGNTIKVVRDNGSAEWVTLMVVESRLASGEYKLVRFGNAKDGYDYEIQIAR